MNTKCSAMVVWLLVGASIASLRGQSLSNFTPSYGSPGETVYINGSGFYYSGMSVNPVVQVQFGGTLASFYIASDNQIVATVPSGASTGSIGVRKASGAWIYFSQTFMVIGLGPYVSGFSPIGGNAGTTVYIDGAHFTGATALYFNGVSAAGFVQSDTRIQATAPNGVTTGPITVARTGWGTNTSTDLFYVPPVITGFSPTNGRPATNVVLTGQNFIGTTAVYFNNLLAGFTTPTSNTNLVVTVPVGATTGRIRLVTAASYAYETSGNFVVQPTLSGFSPGFGPVGTAVTISGANLNVGTPTVMFGSVPATIVTNVSSGQLTAVVPSGATNAFITVTTVNGSGVSSVPFYLPPAITSFTPTNSTAGTTVTITGQNFLGATLLYFNNMPATFTPPTNNTAIYAVVPVSFTTGPLIVSTPGGTTNSGSKLFYAPPEIASFNPTHGLPGTNVVIAGANLLGTTAVRFGGLTATFTAPTNNSTLVAAVPANATNAPITVVAPAGSVTSAGVFTLDYTSDLRVTVTDTPDPVFVGSNLVYSISVSNPGPFAAPNAALSNTLPASVVLKGVTSSFGTVSTSGNSVVVDFGTLSKGSSAVVTVTAVPQTVGWITNVAAVASSYPDPVTTNSTAATPTLVQPLPLLSIRHLQSDQVRISWPVALSNFSLQYLPAFSATNYWSNVTTTVHPVGEENVVTETNQPATKFYRLKQ